MKKLIALLLALVSILSLAACSQEQEAAPTTEAPTTEAPTTVPTEPAKVTETENVTLEGVYVDSAYADGDSADIKQVYVFLTIKATSKAIDVDAQYTDLIIEGGETYQSEFRKNSCLYMPNYYYSSFIEEVAAGSELKVALTFEIPESALEAGKKITFSDSSMPLSDLKISTDDVIVCATMEEVAAAADPEGCAEITQKMEPADDATVKTVKAGMNGYYWTFYVSAGTSLMKYELEFIAPDKFEIRTPVLTNNGTYEVRNGFIILTYPSNGGTVEIKYEMENGEVSLYLEQAFSIYE